MTATQRRHCLCGGTAEISSTPPSAAEDIARMWDEIHAGEGHGPVEPPRPLSKRAREWAKDMPTRLLHVAAVALVDNTPSDAHANEGARKAVAAVLRELTRADCPKTITAWDIRVWANEAERTEP